METVTLNNGVVIPVLGLGTFTLSPDEAEFSVTTALMNGYSLIDTANCYCNEKGVGRGIRNSGVRRDKIFLETKLWPTEFHDEDAVDKTLERLGVDYIDLMLIHQPAGDYIAGYKLLEKAYHEGKIRAIGVSNFSIKQLERLLKECEVVPALIQSEAHPFCYQKEVVEFARSHNIAFQSWYPLGHGDQNLLKDPVISRLSLKHHKTNAEILLRWQIQMGFIAIPGSKDMNHIIENLDIFDFELDSDDMKEIATLDKGVLYYPQNPEDDPHFFDWKPDIEGQK
ncbi:MAG: aldo/keto reductase [Coprobacillus sp.]|nr:aldo/keto reductase [Coprobacillus sp.]